MIIGSLPLVGVSYQSKAKDMQYFQELASNRAAIAKIYQQAIDYGITTFAASPFPEQLAENHILELVKLGNTHPITVMPNVSIPLAYQGQPVDVYRRWATVIRAYTVSMAPNSGDSLLKTFLADPILQFRPNWQDNLTHAFRSNQWYTQPEFASIQLFSQEVEENLSKLAKLPIREVEFGSELDFLFATGRVDLVGDLFDMAHAAGYEVAFGIHHAGLSLPKIREVSSRVKSILTPINPLGVMMFPSQEISISEIKKTLDRYRIIGIKCLAGGRVPPTQAFEYIQGKVDDFMVGVASISELTEAFNAAQHTELMI